MGIIRNLAKNAFCTLKMLIFLKKKQKNRLVMELMEVIAPLPMAMAPRVFQIFLTIPLYTYASIEEIN